MLTDDDLFGQSRALLQTITRDEKLRLYHARHTFNSSLQVQFQMRKRPSDDLIDFLNLDISSDKDARLRSASMGREDWGRKDQHIQAILAGHASPCLTNQYYNHLSDILLGVMVKQKRDRVPISINTAKMLSGLSTSRAAELLTKQDNHPLEALVKLQTKKFATQLLHPLLENALPMQLESVQVTSPRKLPPWEEIIYSEICQDLKRGKKNWELAYLIYEGTRNLDGRRFKTAVAIFSQIKNWQDRTSKRWRGPTYSGETKLRQVLALLVDIGVEPDCFHLVHHPQRSQSKPQQKAALAGWQNKISIPVDGWFSGEAGNTSTTPTKGAVEVRVCNPGINKTTNKKQPAMSRGFEVAVELVALNLLSNQDWAS